MWVKLEFTNLGSFVLFLCLDLTCVKEQLILFGFVLLKLVMNSWACYKYLWLMNENMHMTESFQNKHCNNDTLKSSMNIEGSVNEHFNWKKLH